MAVPGQGLIAGLVYLFKELGIEFPIDDKRAILHKIGIKLSRIDILPD